MEVKAHMLGKSVRAYLMRVSGDGETIYAGYLSEMGDTLKALQGYVGRGKVEMQRLAGELEGFAVVYGSAGRKSASRQNRLLMYDGMVFESFGGNILCARYGGGAFASVSEGDIPAIEGHLKPVYDFPGRINRAGALPKWRGLDIGKCRARYPKGTKLRLTGDLDDPFCPKKKGDACVVDYVDDAGNIHVFWEPGGTLALIIGVDSFEEMDKTGECQG